MVTNLAFLAVNLLITHAPPRAAYSKRVAVAKGEAKSKCAHRWTSIRYILLVVNGYITASGARPYGRITQGFRAFGLPGIAVANCRSDVQQRECG